MPKTDLRSYALSLPEASEEFPWGDRVVKVRKKIFVFLGESTIAVKLPYSAPAALSVPGAEPTHYGLGRAGWVTIPLGDAPSAAILREWIQESYCAVAPKRLAATLVLPRSNESA